MTAPTTILTNFSRASQQYGRTVGLLAAIIAGILVPQAAVLSELIQYMVFAMLFLAFVGLKFERSALRPNLIGVLIANIGIALAAFFVLIRVDGTLALVGFMVGISPTAISSPVVIGLLQKRVDYIVMALLLTNVGIALIVPFLLPWLAGSQVEISMWAVLWSVTKIVLFPLVLARLVKYLPRSAQNACVRAKSFTFILWIGSLFLILAKASQFIRTNATISYVLLLQIAAVCFVLFVVNFSTGALLGGNEFRRETSQALGQKNLSFTIWLALTFINPIVALGPTFYIILHNTYNSLIIYLYLKKKAAKSHEPLPASP